MKKANKIFLVSALITSSLFNLSEVKASEQCGNDEFSSSWSTTCIGSRSEAFYRGVATGANSRAGEYSNATGSGSMAINNDYYEWNYANDYSGYSNSFTTNGTPGSWNQHIYSTYRQNSVYGIDGESEDGEYYVASRQSLNGNSGEDFYRDYLSNRSDGEGGYRISTSPLALINSPLSFNIFNDIVYGSVANGYDSTAILGSVATGDSSVALNYSSATGAGSYATEGSVANGYFANAVNGSVSNGYFAYADDLSVATGFLSFATQGSVASGAFSSATGNNSVAIGYGSNAEANNSVALGANSYANRPNTVSVGSAGSERQITNVAPGTQGTDAVNVNQLTKVKEKATAGIAMAMAMGGGANIPQGKNNAFTMAVGAFDTQQALAASYTTVIGPSSQLNASVGYSGFGGSNETQLGARIGATYSW